MSIRGVSVRDLRFAATTDPEIQAARRRIKETLHDLQDRGFDKMSRKQMVYCSRE